MSDPTKRYERRQVIGAMRGEGSSPYFMLQQMELLGLIVAKGDMVSLTEEGCRAADMGFAKWYKRHRRMVSLQRYSVVISVVSALVSIVAAVVSWLA